MGVAGRRPTFSDWRLTKAARLQGYMEITDESTGEMEGRTELPGHPACPVGPASHPRYRCKRQGMSLGTLTELEAVTWSQDMPGCCLFCLRPHPIQLHLASCPNNQGSVSPSKVGRGRVSQPGVPLRSRSGQGGQGAQRRGMGVDLGFLRPQEESCESPTGEGP